LLIDAQPGGIVARNGVRAYTALAVRGADRTCEWRPSSTGSDEANT
jgi:hypothetical protein